MAQLRACVEAEMSRLKAIYIKSTNLFLDQKNEMVNDNLRKMSLSYTYSFDGQIVT